jgi:hypothetical protein
MKPDYLPTGVQPARTAEAGLSSNLLKPNNTMENETPNGAGNADDACGTDCDLRHHLRNTIVLLGGRKEIADLLVTSIDRPVTEAEVKEIQRYNYDLLTLAKRRLIDLGSIGVRTSPKE